MNALRMLSFSALLILFTSLPLPAEELQTVAESSGSRSTARPAEVVGLVERIDAASDAVTAMRFGQSAEGRPLVAVIAAHPAVNAPEALANDQRLVVLLLAGVHADECEGTEALLALLRDLAQNSPPSLLDHVVLMIVPQLNVDGAQRQGTHHRPAGWGAPEQVGRHVNAQEVDIDRDFMKLRAPETRALVELVNRWSPHILIDVGTSSVLEVASPLVLDHPQYPTARQESIEWLKKEFSPTLTQVLTQQQYESTMAGTVDVQQATYKLSSYYPRRSVDYFALRGRLALKADVALHLSYEQRLRCLDAYLRTTLGLLADKKDQIRSLALTSPVTESSATPSPDDAQGTSRSLALRVELAKSPNAMRVKLRNPPLPPTEVHEQELQLYDQLQVTMQVALPYAYLIPFEQSRIADRLKMHGVRLEQLKSDTPLRVQTYRLKEAGRSGPVVDGESPWRCEVDSDEKEMTIPARTYVMRVDQPLGELAAYLLEPAAEDGFAANGFFASKFVAVNDLFPVQRLNAAASLPTEEVPSIKPAQKLDLDQIYGPARQVSFGPASPAVRWLPQSADYLRHLNGQAMRVSAETGAVEPFYDPQAVTQSLSMLAAMPADDAQRLARSLDNLDPAGTAMFFNYEHDLYYCRLDGTRSLRLTSSPADERLAQFSPDGKLIAFVRDHNLFVVDVAQAGQRQLTTDGDENHLYGELDWVYQEEIYGRGEFRGFWWSPDSRALALLALDETPVHRHAVADHLSFQQRLDFTAYPKSGEPLPKVRLGVVTAAGGEPVWVRDPYDGPLDKLIVRVGWTPDSGSIVYQLQDRKQQWLELRRANARTGETDAILKESSSAWVDVLGEPIWLRDGAFLWLSHRDGHARVYRTSADGKMATAITPENWEVTTLHGMDAEQEWCFVSALESDSIAEQIVRISLRDGSTEKISKSDGFHTARFSTDLRFWFDSSSQSHHTPAIELRRADGTALHSVLPPEDDDLRYFDLAAPEVMRVASRDGVMLDALLIKPPDFDPQRKYPIICYVYGGPQIATVRDRWGGTTYLWHQMLAQRGYCIWLCDNRSASQRGVAQSWPVYSHFGAQELRDLEDSITWLKNQPWCDGERIAIWGWSYGGYLTSYALTHSNLFRAGIAGAPVTDWRNYDAIYTERYMGLPQENAAGYAQASVVAAAPSLAGRLLLIHGDADDNVHLGNTLQLAQRLQLANKQFDLMIYPQATHGVTQADQVRHLRELMTQFLETNLAR